MSLFALKSLDQLQKEAEAHTLKRALGPLNLISLGIGAIIGAGLFSLTGIAAAENAGPAIVLSFVVAAIGCAFAGLCYSEFSSMIPIAGSAYTYGYATMGEWLAWIIGWDLVLEYAVGASTVSISWSAYVNSVLRDIGIVLPASLCAGPFEAVKLPDGTLVQGIVNVPAVFIVCIISVLLMIGIRESAWVNAVVVVIKLTVVIVVIAVGFWYIRPDNYTPFIPENTGKFGEFGWSGIMRAAGVIFFAYIGFDAVSTAAQEARRPQRDMPIGIIGSLAICTVLYILFSTVLTGIVNYKDLASAAPVAKAVEWAPAWLRMAVKLGIICGFTSVILVMLLGQSRVFFAMANDGLLPRVFRDIHPTWRTPYRSNMLFMLFVSLFAAFAPISVVGHMTSIGTLLAFVIVCGGIMIMRRTRPDLPRPFRTPLVPWVPILGIVVCVAMMYSLGPENWFRLIVWLAIGQILFFTYGRTHSHLRRAGERGHTFFDRGMAFGNLGVLLGGAVGFMMRPLAPNGKLISFDHVIDRGGAFQAMVDKFLRRGEAIPIEGLNADTLNQFIEAAKASFNTMLLGAFAGVVLGIVIGLVVHKARDHAPVAA